MHHDSTANDKKPVPHSTSDPHEPTENHPEETFTGERTSVRQHAPSLADFAKKIKASWHGNTRSILTTARHCAEASAALPRRARASLIKEVPFSAATFSKLNQIGQNARLRENDVAAVLPANFSAIYAVSKLNDEEFDLAIQAGVLHPRAKRADVIAYIKSKLPPDALPSKGNPQPRSYATIRLANDSPAVIAMIEQALQTIIQQPGVQIVRRSSDQQIQIFEK
jgi:hypothetical protein